MTRDHILGTSSLAVLRKLTERRSSGTWNTQTGAVLYENKGMTRQVCHRLWIQGFLTEAREDDGSITYSVNSEGKKKASALGKAPRKR